MTSALEANFDGLVGPTHNYAGLAHGNVASRANRERPSNPRQAALQGLEKMRRLAALGLPQAVIPPLERPDLAWLQALGYSGREEAVLERAFRDDPVLLAAAGSASSMWTANAATVCPSADSADGKVHVTPANLSSQVHRSLEPSQTSALLRRIFPGASFVHHDPLPAGRHFADEGAANHTRLAPSHGLPGVQLFVYGYESLAAGAGPQAASARRTGGAAGGRSRVPARGRALERSRAPDGITRRFLPRQSREACEAVARLHGLDPSRVVLARQDPAAVDAGVFHNDVISVGNEGFFLCHERAFASQGAVLAELRRKYADLGAGPLRILEVEAREVSLAEAVSTYLFNSQILTLPEGGMLLLAAGECRRNARVRRWLERLPGRSPVVRVEYADLRQSMRNGGGPACLRLRVPLTAREWSRVPPGVKLDEALYRRLKAWVERHYRDRLLPRDLADPALLRESRAALDALTGILGLGSVYPFQR